MRPASDMLQPAEHQHFVRLTGDFLGSLSGITSILAGEIRPDILDAEVAVAIDGCTNLADMLLQCKPLVDQLHAQLNDLASRPKPT